MRKLMLAALATAILALVVAPNMHASVSGSIGFASPTLTQASANPTGNINTSTLFELDDWTTTKNATGIFAGLSPKDFGTVSLLTLKSTGLKFGDSVFGTFDSTKITASSSGPGFLDILAVGIFNAGSIAPGSPAATAVTRIALTQTPPMNGEISASGTMSITAAVVPEPPAVFLFGSGLLGMVGLLGIPKFRRRLVGLADHDSRE